MRHHPAFPQLQTGHATARLRIAPLSKTAQRLPKPLLEKTTFTLDWAAACKAHSLAYAYLLGASDGRCCIAGDDEARNRGTQKSVLERKAPATFPVVIEMRERAFWVTHWTEDSVDSVLQGKTPVVQVVTPGAPHTTTLNGLLPGNLSCGTHPSLPSPPLHLTSCQNYTLQQTQNDCLKASRGCMDS